MDNELELSTRPKALAWALILTVIVLILVLYRLQPPAPKNIESPPGDFSAARAMTILQSILVDNTSHAVDTENNRQVMAYIIEYLEALDYDVQVQESFACRGTGLYANCATVRNILTQLPGEHASPAVALVAHYDSVGAGPGVADDGANVALILEIARILKAEGPYPKPIIFLLTDGEEEDLLGAQAFVEEHPWAQNIGVVINLEARGTSGQSLMFETSDNNAWLVDAYASTAQMPAASSIFFEIYRTLPNNTDFTIFKEAGIAGVNFAFIENSHYYHTPLDNRENLDLGSVQHQGDNMLGLVRYFAITEPAGPTTGNAVYMDLLGFMVLQWPESWTLFLVFLAVLLLLIVSVRLIRQKHLTVRKLFWGILAGFLSVILSIGISFGITWITSTITGFTMPWYGYPMPTRLALWMAGVFSGMVVTGALARRAGLWGLSLGIWFLWSLLALAFTLTLTGIAIIFLLPTLFASILLVCVVYANSIRLAPIRETAFILMTVMTAVIWFPLSILFEIAVGLQFSSLVAVPITLVLTVMAPLFVLPSRQTQIRRFLLAVVSGTMIVASIIAIFVPVYSTERPQGLNLIHFEDRDTGDAYWVADSSSYIPNSLQEQANFAAEPQNIFPWSNRKSFTAETTPSTDPAPDLKIISDDIHNGKRSVQVRLMSFRGADGIHLFIPVKDLASMTVAGKTFAVEAEAFENSLYRFSCYGYSCSEVDIELQFTSEDPTEVLLIDWTYGLPVNGKEIEESRSTTAVPSHNGDLTMILSRKKI